MSTSQLTNTKQHNVNVRINDVAKLAKAEDFSKDAPILIITDAECDKIVLYGREHAFLIPQGAHLPFVPKGKVFRMK